MEKAKQTNPDVSYLQTKSLSHTVRLVLCALFAALTAALSQLSIPLPSLVPINLATLSVFLAGGVLGAKLGLLSQAVYILLGAVGLPVFSNFNGGIHVLVGPTGGYIWCYAAAAWLVGLLSYRLAGRRGYWGLLVLSMVAGLAVCYTLGTIWFIVVTKSSLWAALWACVFPFLPGDALKIILAATLVPQLHKALRRAA